MSYRSLRSKTTTRLLPLMLQYVARYWSPWYLLYTLDRWSGTSACVFRWTARGAQGG